jgi:hypothetical protein
MTLEINHDLRFKKFFANVNGKQCWLKYKIVNSHIMELEVLFIPIELRGQGFAKKLIEQAVNYAKSKFLKIVPICSYIKSFFEVNFQYNDLMYIPKFNYNSTLSYN